MHINRSNSRAASRSQTALVDTEQSTVTTGLLTSTQAARYLQVSPRTLWDLTDKREIASVHIGRLVRYTREDLDDYVRAVRVPVTRGCQLAPLVVAANSSSASTQETTGGQP